jgi:hypothetical protein
VRRQFEAEIGEYVGDLATWWGGGDEAADAAGHHHPEIVGAADLGEFGVGGGEEVVGGEEGVDLLEFAAVWTFEVRAMAFLGGGG